jgi:phage tail sheath protein FI
MITVENTTPGVVALVNTGAVARPISRQPSSTAFLGGYTPFGPVGTPVVVTSFLEFTKKFGSFNANSHLADAVYVFFNMFGGAQAVISRVVGDDAAVSTLTLDDNAGTPVDTVQVDSKYPTELGITVKVETGTTSGKKLTFRCATLGIEEVFDNFTLADIADVNLQSQLVTLTDLESATVAPNNLPKNIAATALTGGDDDFAGITATNYVNSLTAFADTNLGGGQVAIPGQTASSVLVALKSHAEAYQRLAIMDAAFGNDVSEMLAVDTTTYRSNAAALYYPWLKGPKLDGTSGDKWFPPSIAALGACAHVDRNEGTQKAPANIAVPFAYDVERNTDGSKMLTDTARGSLAAKQINVIAPITNEGLKIYDAQLLFPVGETRLRFIHERRVVNLVYHSARLGFNWAVFQTVDPQGRLFRDLVSAGQNFCRSLYRAGALYGATEEEAFVVTADASNNLEADLALGRVHVAIGIKISPTAQQVIVNIDNVPLGQALSVLGGN